MVGCSPSGDGSPQTADVPGELEQASQPDPGGFLDVAEIQHQRRARFHRSEHAVPVFSGQRAAKASSQGDDCGRSFRTDVDTQT
jgi:hypothetical protein